MTDGKHSLWYKDAVIYEMHVKAFADSKGDGRGDFRGLLGKLDYLQHLGVTAIWLLPFYPSPLRDDGYDISDYRSIHPHHGNLRDFRLLVREAHRRSIRVITELVINHTSDQHPWFQAARRARRGSARRDFYVWSDTDTRFPETRIIFTDTESSNWAWDAVAGQYYWHRFFSHQPDLNLNNPRVVQAVIKILRFWLKLGVDGLRLDAVPYLCVRDGTGNENLEETHAVIRQIRRAVDAEFSDRMLLAEANQWPADVRPYFGDGDECHMAFHFPLMPRIFMALRQEDRRPITDIMRQTPDIPDNCQWALFLRNHDELTLEMVTDQERDYMYHQYAADPRMRLNLGIRRRLAPLVDNSMRRIELLNSLLFSFPGTPVIYYGDEIGMGDNIYLGDRDGVRTPMQWSADRNAGFSRADPARLYLPPIMDPVYGYEAVNVEAQERNPSSLLHFMRRLIALRRQHKAFGRGTLEFLRPSNRKVLAYLRRYRGEVILAVANLSRFVQPVELALREFDGWMPVEMMGRIEFPPIGELPYFLTLGPHAFYWFRLEPQAEPISLAVPGKAGAVSLPSLQLEEGEELLSEPARHVLEQDVLPVYLARQRWFRSKAREMISLRIMDWSKLGGGFFLSFCQVHYVDGQKECYVVPLKLIMGAAATKVAQEIPDSLIARVRAEAGEGVLCDALADRTSVRTLFQAMVDGRQYPTSERGRVQFFPAGSLAADTASPPVLQKIRRLGAEQSNTSIVLDGAYILKVFRTIESGPNPDLEISLFLTERTSFRHIAEVAGGITYQQPSGRMATVAMLQRFVPSRGDGWEDALTALAGYLERVADQPAAGAMEGAELRAEDLADDLEPRRPDLQGTLPPLALVHRQPPPAVREAAADSLRDARLLGQRTAELHLALSGHRQPPEFEPKRMTTPYLEGLADRFSRQAQASLELLSSRLSLLPEAVRQLADLVLGVGSQLLAEFREMGSQPIEATRIRCHGDYHLGQVLRDTEGDYVLLDFEGEPLRTLAERRERTSPLKDVAGMLRSYSYAARTALARQAGEDESRRARLRPWAAAWERWVQAAFLAGYLNTAAEADFLPRAGRQLETLLRGFLLDKTFYELGYELNNRPDWVAVPLAGILEMARFAPGAGNAAGKES
jgi:maltose alpha-D-glucosyltransferase/alpha-amylase